ncbi:MAG: Rieske (2Fe-2S) protein [Gemmatimonadetes bacterium]|nr:Rieske (2Fe-2S) protein [Gemmatimonadota bacterium]
MGPLAPSGVLPPDAFLDADAGVSRRAFLTASAMAAIAATLAGCMNASDATAPGVRIPAGVSTTATTTVIDLLTQTALAATTGAYLIIENASRSLIVINIGSNTFRALSAVCTHQGCLIGGMASNVIFCNCHGSRFNATGGVVQGPANASLPSFTATYDGVAKTVTVAG